MLIVLRVEVKLSQPGVTLKSAISSHDKTALLTIERTELKLVTIL